MTTGFVEAATPAAPARPHTPVRRAVSDSLPFALGLIPFGLAAGGAAAEAGLSLAAAMFGATTMLAGAAQIAAIEAIDDGVGLAGVVTVVALINLRFVLYGAGVASWFADAPRRQRLALAYPVVDQTFLLCQHRFEEHAAIEWRRRYYLTVTAVLGGTFVGAQLVSFRLGASLPAGAGLHLAAPLAFTGLLARSLSSRSGLVAAATAAAVVVVGSSSTGAATLPVAVGLGVAAALVTARAS